jgi:pyrroline-5-carboxylate reductase
MNEDCSIQSNAPVFYRINRIDETTQPKGHIMTNRTIGFVGGGRITRIILEGWKRQGALPANITVSDCNVETLNKLKAEFPAITAAAGNSQAAAACDVVFLAVHPPVMAEVAAGIKEAIQSTAIVVSLAPKFTISKLGGLLGGFGRIARVIPNAPSLIGAGYNPVCFAEVLRPEDRQVLNGLLTPFGESPEVQESKLEGYALLTGMGPTYLWFQLETLRHIARGCGLTDADITPAMKRMVCGSARTLLESGLTAEQVMDLIPVKPLAEEESRIRQCYLDRLPSLYTKIKP